jgi:hypothetical protein
MASVLDRLDAREQAAAGRIEKIQKQIAALAAELAEAEAELERLRIGRAVLTEVLAEDEPAAESTAQTQTVSAVTVAPDKRDGRRWQAVPHRSDDPDLGSLPQPYRDVLEVMDDAAVPLRAVDLCRSLGLGVQARFTEAMRGKLNRLVERGWCVSPESGRYALAPGVCGRIG